MPFQKGHKLATGRPLGSKNRETLVKEERRAVFEQKATEMWEDVISKLPPTYIADQFMGKASDRVELKVESEPNEKIKKLADKLRSIDNGIHD